MKNLINAGLLALAITTFTPTVTHASNSGVRYSISLESGGISINGHSYFDAIGEITEFSPHSETNFITYIVRDPDGEEVVKVLSIDDVSDVYEIGAFDSRGGTLKFYSEDAVYYYEQYKIVSRGVILIEGNTITYLSPDSIQGTITLPQKFELSRMQSDDISATKHALLRFTSNESGARSFRLVNVITGEYTEPFRLSAANDTEPSLKKAPISMQYSAKETAAPVALTFDEGYARVVLRNLHANQF